MRWDSIFRHCRGSGWRVTLEHMLVGQCLYSSETLHKVHIADARIRKILAGLTFKKQKIITLISILLSDILGVYF